jgi:hypothetical protein
MINSLEIESQKNSKVVRAGLIHGLPIGSVKRCSYWEHPESWLMVKLSLYLCSQCSPLTTEGTDKADKLLKKA